MTMMSTWIPPDISEACAVHTTVTTCSHSTLIFLQLIASLFGYSIDSANNKLTIPNYSFVSQQQYNPGYSFDDGVQYSTGSTAGYEDYGAQEIYAGTQNYPQIQQIFPDASYVENQANSEEYDFIVIGAGSAGCVVANRLSEIHEWKILLLEAGSEEPKVAGVPAFAPMLQRSSIDWAYMTQPSPHSCLARPNGQCAWARGKVMGGSSTINYMIYIRGSPEDYDDWAKMGNHGWSYEEVLPYFIKAEHNMNPEHIDSYYHGQHGYQSVSFYPYQDVNVFHLIGAFRELGLHEHDQNADHHQIGVSLLQATVKDGMRASTNVAYIRPIRRKRKNLTIRTNTHVTRVLIDPHTKKAFGVEYSSKGQLKRILARKEVILSAGAINSPQLLMVSGIGPANDLFTHGIQVIKDLPVGQNLHDHTTIDGVVFALTNKTATSVDDERRNADVHYYKEKHRGPLSAPGPLQVNAMVQTKYEHGPKLPDIQYSFDAANVKNFYSDPILTAQTNVLPLAYYDGLMVRPVLLNPKSRGYILLNDTDPVYGQPLIHANTFFEEIDLLRMIEGIKQSLNLLKTHSMMKIQAQLVTTPLPACYNYEFGTDEYWACVIMSYTTTIFHPVGTCKMGPKGDKTAVVNPKLQVHGIKNLRVIDASIMPKIPRGNTNAPTIMIAEKTSDYIKERWLKGHSGNLVQEPSYVSPNIEDYYSWSF